MEIKPQTMKSAACLFHRVLRQGKNSLYRVFTPPTPHQGKNSLWSWAAPKEQNDYHRSIWMYAGKCHVTLTWLLLNAVPCKSETSQSEVVFPAQVIHGLCSQASLIAQEAFKIYCMDTQKGQCSTHPIFITDASLGWQGSMIKAHLEIHCAVRQKEQKCNPR